MKTTVWVTFQLEGWHRWPKAPETAIYLRRVHRHMFHYRVEVAVSHAEREVEFHQLRLDCINFATQHLLEQESASCETLAKRLLQSLNQHRVYSISVSEDGENGATIYA